MTLPSNDEKTEVLHNVEDMFRITLEDYSNVKETVDIFSDRNGPSIMVPTDSPSMFIPIKKLWSVFKELTKKGVRVRFITEITNENISYCRELVKASDLRHLDEIRFGGFGLYDGVKYRASRSTKEEQTPSELIMSNVKELVEKQGFVFDTLWSRAIPAKQRFKEIEENVKREFVETFREPAEIRQLFFNLIKSAKEEILLLCSTANAFHRLEKLGILPLVVEIAQRSVSIRILLAIDARTEELIKKLSNKKQTEINFHSLGRFSYPNITALVMDTEMSVVVDIKDDSKENFEDAIGLSTYSNNESTVATYTSIFETLWMQSELHEHNEQIKVLDD
jgi:two-component system, OmpR family, sensor histidine kinase VicK